MASKRLAWFDNSKGILIFLVIFGHAIELYRNNHDNTVVLWLYNSIYAFHMPLFILISGYFFREGRLKRVIQFMGVYLIWQIINGFLSPLIMSHSMPDLSSSGRIFKLLTPYWTLWYLLGMIVWRLITPYFLKMRFPIVIAIGLAIWVSFVPDVTGWMSLRKLINFYPFYLIGYLFAEQNVFHLIQEQLKTRGKQWRAGAAFVLVAFLSFMAFYTYSGFQTDFLFMRDSYSHFGWAAWKGGLISILFYAGVTVLCLAIMILIPKEKKLPLFNRMGTYSLYIYLLHANVIRLFRSEAPGWLTHHPLTLIPTAIILALLIGSIASSRIIVRLFSPIIEPSFKALFAKSDRATKPSRAYAHLHS